MTQRFRNDSDDGQLRHTTRRDHAMFRNRIAKDNWTQQQWDENEPEDELIADDFTADETLEQLGDIEDLNRNDPRMQRHSRFDGPR